MPGPLFLLLASTGFVVLVHFVGTHAATVRHALEWVAAVGPELGLLASVGAGLLLLVWTVTGRGRPVSGSAPWGGQPHPLSTWVTQPAAAPAGDPVFDAGSPFYWLPGQWHMPHAPAYDRQGYLAARLRAASEASAEAEPYFAYGLAIGGAVLILLLAASIGDQ